MAMSKRGNAGKRPQAVGVASEKIDPTLPFTEIVIDGKTYKMCLDFGALAEAERELEKTDPTVSLLECSWGLGKLQNLRVLFAASLRLYHPQMSVAERMALVTWGNAGTVLVKVRIAQGMFAPEAEANPPEAAPAAVSE
jgi:hypothetical protein